MSIHPLAGNRPHTNPGQCSPADLSLLHPPARCGHPAQRVAFGTSGHRGSSLNNNFNEAHILAISQAIC